jgi:hypothetical protein
MDRRLVAALVVGTLGCGGGGAGVAVATDYDPEADFGSYQTYVWVEDLEPFEDEQVDAFVREAVDAGLAAKGLQRVDTEAADLAVGYRVAINNSTTQEMIGRGFHGGYTGATSYSGGGAGVMQRDVEHTSGTLFVILFDGESREMAWTGVGNSAVDPDLDPEARQERINVVVDEILQAYPPG